MRGKPYPPETKAAVMAALLAGQSIGAVAAEYRISQSTASAWRGLSQGGLTFGGALT